jgi:hypothetical protein
MSFNKEGHKHTLKGLQVVHQNHQLSPYGKSLEERSLSIISQFNAIQVMDNSPQEIHLDL